MDFNISQRVAVKKWLIDNIDEIKEKIVFIKNGESDDILNDLISKLQRPL